MTTFNDRENAFENKFAFDAETQFKIDARAVKAVALWAAELMGRSGPEAQAYVAEVIAADFDEAGQEDVIRKLAADLKGKADAPAIRARLAQARAEAAAALARP